MADEPGKEPKDSHLQSMIFAVNKAAETKKDKRERGVLPRLLGDARERLDAARESAAGLGERARNRLAELRRKTPAADQPAEGGDGPKTPPNTRIRTPTLLQMEAVECGAAALGIILSHFGRIVPLEKLRVECGVSRDGSRASNVLRAARRFGLEAKGFKRELDGLYELKLPVILFWNFNHFLVLEGFKGDRVFLNDPATGPRTVSIEELDASFSGVVLTFEPNDEFEKGGSNPSITAALRRRLQGYERALMFVVLCGLFLVIPGLIVPTFTRVFIDEFLVGQRGEIITPLLGGMCFIALVTMALTFLQERYLIRLETAISIRGTTQFMNHILRLPVSYFGQRFAGEISSRVMINDKVAQVVSGQLATTLLDCVLIVFYGGLMFIYDATLTVICISIATLNFIAVKLAARPRADASRALAQEQGKLIGTAMGGLQMVETIKATGSEPEFFERWAGYQSKALKAAQKLGQIGEMVNIVPPAVQNLTTAAVLVFGGMKVMNGEMTVGMLVAYQFLLTSFVRPLNTLVGFGAMIQELQADMNRIDDVLEHPIDNLYVPSEFDPGAEGLVKLSGHVELRGVTFGFSPLDKPLIEDFNLTVKPGQRVALVGGSGSGKSTVGRLVAGLYEPWEGEILFDGMERRKLPRELITNSLAMVDQEIFLFNGTIRENITMWDRTMDDRRVFRAAQDSEIAEVIEQRDQGYGSIIEEGGFNFSGGQKQRLEIARALVAEPTILCLDEATSALDPKTELLIDDALRRRGCSCIIVAHRLSTIRDADEIVVLYRGKIEQRGTHEELMSQPGPYALLMKE